MKAYTDLVQYVYENGEDRTDRTNTGTISEFGTILEVDLIEGFPLTTHKRTSFKNVIGELIWFMSGETNIKPLLKHNIKIWNDWANENGDLGPVYGAQWRGRGKKVDQLAQVIYDIINNPFSRRLIVNAWDADVLPDPTIDPKTNAEGIQHLPPCHFAFQFYVHTDGRLDLMWSQRSCDIILGTPYNLASYAALVHIVAQMTGCTPGKVRGSFGDTHIYKTHVNEGCMDMIYNAELHPLPSFDVTDVVDNVSHLTLEQISEYLDSKFNLETNVATYEKLCNSLINYQSGKASKFTIAV